MDSIAKQPNPDDASNEGTRENTSSKREIIKESIKEQNTMGKSIDQNEKQCTSYFRASSNNEQSSSQSNNDLESWEKNSKLEGTSLNTLEKLHNSIFNKFEKNYPHRSIALLYQLELSILCLLRKNAFENVSEPIFRNYRFGKFNNIKMCLDGEYVCIRVQHVDTYYVKRTLDFNSFFSVVEGNFTLKNYLNEFAAELLNYLENDHPLPKYLIMYTNSGLDITGDKKLRQDLADLQLVNFETDPKLINFLFNNKGEMYRFANDENTRNQLSNLVKVSRNVNQQIRVKGFLGPEIIQAFFDRLILAVNQPSIEELIDIVRSEIGNGDLIQLRQQVMGQWISEDDNPNSVTVRNLLSTVYSFNLFVFFMHEMFVNGNISEMKINEKGNAHIVALNVQNRIYIKVLEVDIDQLSLKELSLQRKIFSIDSLFSAFIEELDKDDYFLIYTNVSLLLLRELIMGNSLEQSKQTYRPKFDRINTEDKRYSFLKHPCINADSLYQFSPEGRKTFLDLFSVQQTKKTMEISPQEMEEKKAVFLDKVVFAVKQYNSDEIYKAVEKAIRSSFLPYDKLQYSCEELYKIGLRYLMSHEFDAMTKDVLITLCDDIRNKPHVETIEDGSFQEEIKFAKDAIVMAETPEFSDFVTFLTRGKGKLYFDNLRSNRYHLSRISSFFKKPGRKKVKQEFTDLYNSWFNKKDNGLLKQDELYRSDAAKPSGYKSSLDQFDNLACEEVKEGPQKYWEGAVVNTTEMLKTVEDTMKKLTELLQFEEDEIHEEVEKEKFTENATAELMKTEVEEILQKSFTENVIGTTESDSEMSSNYSSNESSCEEVCDKTKKKLQKNREDSERGELKRKISSVLNLFPSWKNGTRCESKKKRIIHEVIRIFNDDRKLKDFLEHKVNKKLISQNDFEDLYSLISHKPFTETEVLGLLQDELESENKKVKRPFDWIRELDRLLKEEEKKGRKLKEKEFGKIIFGKRNKEIDGLAEFLSNGDGKRFLAKLKLIKLPYIVVAKMFTGCLSTDQVIKGIKELDIIWFDANYPGCCINLTREDVKLIVILIRIIGGSGIHAGQAFKNMYNLWFRSGKQTEFLTSFHEIGIKTNKISLIFKQSGLKASEIYQAFYHLFFDSSGRKTQYLIVLEREIDLRVLFKILAGTKRKVCETFKELYHLWFDFEGHKSEYVRNLETCGISLNVFLNLLIGKEGTAPNAFRNLYNFLFDEKGNKQEKLKTLEKEIDLLTFFAMLGGGKVDTVKIANELYHLWFDSEGNKTIRLYTLEKNGVDLLYIAGFLKGAKLCAGNNFCQLFNYLFTKNGTKTKQLRNIEGVIELRAMIKIVSGAKTKGFLIFQQLYNLWFDSLGNKTLHLRMLEEKGLSLMEISDELTQSGKKACKKFLKICKSGSH